MKATKLLIAAVVIVSMVATPGLAGDIDLRITAQQEILGPFNRHKLDVVANPFGFEYQDPSVNGFVVGSKYTRYLLDGEEPDWDRLKQYNNDDVTAMRTIVDHIRS
jgi:predicted RecB family nuclease